MMCGHSTTGSSRILIPSPGLRQSPMRLKGTPHPHDLQNVGPPPSSIGHPLPWERAVILISIRFLHGSADSL